MEDMSPGREPALGPYSRIVTDNGRHRLQGQAPVWETKLFAL
mgnify:CR=1 FL=1